MPSGMTAISITHLTNGKMTGIIRFWQIEQQLEKILPRRLCLFGQYALIENAIIVVILKRNPDIDSLSSPQTRPDRNRVLAEKII